jgi:hypothetical protein
MSHVATVDVVIQDLVSLKRAAEALGLEFLEGQTTYRSYQSGLTCTHALRVKGSRESYDIGVVLEPDGKTYRLMMDNYKEGLGLVAKVGYKAERLKQGYAVEVAVRAAKRQGFRVIKRTIRTDGSIELVTQR